MKLKFTEGYIIFIESDDKDGWYFAKPWIREAFYEAINHSTIQTLDVMDTNEITKDITFKELYKITNIQPIDMFPQTHHVENIVVLEIKD